MTDAQYRLLLVGRREQLVQRAEQQRVHLAQTLQPFVRATRRAERGLALWRTLRARPALTLLPVLAPALLLALWKPRAVLRTLAAALALWRAGRSVRASLASLRAQAVTP